VAITIPADYLEDCRSALLEEIASDSHALRSASPNDQRSSAVILSRSTRLLDPLLKATGDTKLTSEHAITSSPLVHMLEAMIRSLLPRLSNAARYGPMPMGDVADLAAKLRWAAEEAIRIDPEVAIRLTSDDLEAVA
jgi:hypothetical protein